LSHELKNLNRNPKPPQSPEGGSYQSRYEKAIVVLCGEGNVKYRM